jgi:hypothetical protein
MKVEEANRIVAEFMGGPYEGDSAYCDDDSDDLIPEIEEKIKNHYVSLDALVPVWEKLSSSIQIYHSPLNDYSVRTPFGQELSDKHETIQQAACIATAKAIKELEGRE